ncbi:MAG: hypothetical protein KDE54_08515 [Caldilineaceae bacterium]|nr:hypothetical protein [Caldilineaceae bacterium]
MKSTITFGKHKGFTPEQLKRMDSDYLRWGANNLNSPKWRKEFQEALDTLTIEDEATEMSNRDMIPFWEAITYLRGMAADDAMQCAQMEDFEAKKSVVIAEWASRSGQTVSKLRSIVDSNKFLFGWDFVTPSQFSTREQYDLFCEYMQKISEI